MEPGAIEVRQFAQEREVEGSALLMRRAWWHSGRPRARDAYPSPSSSTAIESIHIRAFST